MVLKGYPRISESFISSEILLLESLGLDMEIFSLRRPREPFTHASVQAIRAPVTYLPEYVLPHWRTLLTSNRALWQVIPGRYGRCLRAALTRAVARGKPATVRHFLQAGHLTAVGLRGRPIVHLHAHFCHTPASVALFAAELTGLPFSFTAHAKDIYTSDAGQLARKIRQARFVVTCTRYNARHLQSLGDGATPIHTIYHGIDVDFFHFSPSRPVSPPHTILSVGRVVPKKGYDDLFKALKILDRRGLDFRFVHIGSGELDLPMRRMVRDLELAHRVRLLGTLSHEAVIEHYRQAHCFALACKVAPDGDRDGIPNVLAEAMAVGVPVVATRVSAIPELVMDGVTGTLVEAGSPPALAAALEDVLLHPEAHRRRLAAARRRVEEIFDQRRCVADLYELHRQWLAAASRPRHASPAGGEGALRLS
jgi:glycosyltransferase involved in cell wall biosynthesis